MDIKKINVPFAEGLENMDFAALVSTMQAKAAKGDVKEVNWPESFPYAPECGFYIARSKTHIAVLYHVRGLDLRAAALEDNGNVWEDSCCEFFVEAPDGKGYYNFELNCVGTLLNAYGSGRNDRVRTEPSILRRVRRFSSLERKGYDDKDKEFEWSIAMVIPFDMLGVNPQQLPSKLRANFYKCGDKTAHPHFLSWNAVGTPEPDFHRPEFFGELILG